MTWIFVLVKPYEKMTLAQLKEAEDEFDEEDIKAIEIYRYRIVLLWDCYLRNWLVKSH